MGDIIAINLVVLNPLLKMNYLLLVSIMVKHVGLLIGFLVFIKNNTG